MKFVCNKDDILNEIIYSMDFTSQRNSLSITSNVYLETAGGGRLIIRATDQKLGFSTEIAVETLQEGRTTVFCEKKLLNILRSLPNTRIDFSLQDGMLTIKPEEQNIDFKLRTLVLMNSQPWKIQKHLRILRFPRRPSLIWQIKPCLPSAKMKQDIFSVVCISKEMQVA